MPLLLRAPCVARIESFLAEQAELPWTYAEVGATAGKVPPGYFVNHRRSRIGAGRDQFERAKGAVRNWRMFDMDWLKVYWPDRPLMPGTTVAIVAQPVWPACVLAAARIVYTVDEESETHRFGFAYGTLPGHAMRGEEVFLVEWDPRDDSVCYELLSFSQFGSPLIAALWPFVRGAQRRFTADSHAAMRRACAEGALPASLGSLQSA